MTIGFVLALLLALIGVSLFVWQRWPSDELHGEWFRQPDKKGYYIGPKSMAVVIRWPVSFLVPCLVFGVIYCIIVVVSTSVTLYNSWALFIILVLIATLALGWPDKKLIVPLNTVAPLTFVGALTRIYLLEGDYNWWLVKLLFKRSLIARRNFTTRLKDSKPDEIQMEDGFFKITRIPFELWESLVKRVSLIFATSKSGSKIQAEFLITLQSEDPYLVLRNDDAGMEIAERARAGFRTAISFFTSLDVALMKDVIALLIEGHVIVVAFLHKQVGAQAIGSVIRDTGGEPLYQRVVIKDGEDFQQATNRTIKEYIAFLETHATKAMLAGVSRSEKQPGGKMKRIYHIETREVATSLNEILSINGLKLVSASVGTVIIDDELSKAAVTSEKQDFEGSVQVKSAAATAAALKKLKPTAEEKADPLRADLLAIAASSDPGAKNTTYARVSTSGNSPLSEAAAVIVGGMGSTKVKEGTPK